MTRGYKPQMVPWAVGDAIELGYTNTETFTTEWVSGGVVSKVHPLTVFIDNEDKVISMNTLRRRPPKTDEPVVKSELPAEALKELYHKALVQIIKEGSTKTPNATVRKMINIAKEVLGEVPI